MKFLTILLLSAYLLMAGDINWYHNYDQGLKIAKLENKKVILMLSKGA